MGRCLFSSSFLSFFSSVCGISVGKKVAPAWQSWMMAVSRANASAAHDGWFPGPWLTLCCLLDAVTTIFRVVIRDRKLDCKRRVYKGNSWRAAVYFSTNTCNYENPNFGSPQREVIWLASLVWQSLMRVSGIHQSILWVKCDRWLPPWLRFHLLVYRESASTDHATKMTKNLTNSSAVARVYTHIEKSVWSSSSESCPIMFPAS